MSLDSLVHSIAKKHCSNIEDEKGLDDSFVAVCSFLRDNPGNLSWRGKNKPSLDDSEGLELLAEKYFKGYRKSDFPASPGTIPDEMVSIVMQFAYGYSPADCERIKIEHQYSMCAENCVGALLERYIDSILRKEGWHWCCGNFVKSVDFISKNSDGLWLPLQIKNRDNTENSSSSSVRNGTQIQKWHRSFSKKSITNWNNLPPLMQGYNLSEDGFIEFVKNYLTNNKPSNKN